MDTGFFERESKDSGRFLKQGVGGTTLQKLATGVFYIYNVQIIVTARFTVEYI